MTREEIRQQNIDIVQKYLDLDPKFECDIVGSSIATIAQFVVKFHTHIRDMPGEYVSTPDLIKAQISELTQCIIDLQNVLNSHEGALQ